MNHTKHKNMKKINLYIVLLLLTFGFTNAQQTPAKKQTKTIAISGAIAHIGNGEVIENSLIIIEDGKLLSVVDSRMEKVNITNMEVIDATGKHVYPGFIMPNTTLGLVEIDAVRATDDDSELGSWNPHIRSLIAYNAESKVVESLRPNGVLLAQVTPRGGRISGTSSIVQLDAWNWEDAVVKEDDGIHMNWPKSFSRGRSWLGEDPAMKANKNYEKQVKEIANFYNESIKSNDEKAITKSIENFKAALLSKDPYILKSSIELYSQIQPLSIKSC